MDFSQIRLTSDLPISKYEAEISLKLEQRCNLIIIGETGSGKTTQIPLILLKTLSKFQKLTSGKIAITEPRRIAATSVAQHVANLIGEDIGQTVGYKIRFEESISTNTAVIFMTDGILLREAQIDPLLLNYSVVMIDEAHERNINSDFLIGLLVDIQTKRAQQDMIPLKIIVTSATLEKQKFIDFFNNESSEPLEVIEIPGKLFPVECFFENREVLDYESRAADVVQQICTKNYIYKNGEKIHIPTTGDILIFMPGKGEIARTKEKIESLQNFEQLNLEILTIHGDLPIEEQNKIFAKTTKRKVIIATNIAETSLTVPGVIFVIDSGLIKVMEFDPHSGINSLVTKLHARKGLQQRQGRAGRIEPGYYFGLYTEESLNQRDEFPIPEIQRSSLSQIILIMKIIGIHDVEHFKFIDRPEDKHIRAAIQELHKLGAISETGHVTEKGITMASLPLEPRLSNLIIEAEKNRCVDKICSIAAFLELKPVFLNLTYEEIYKKLAKELTAQEENNNIADDPTTDKNLSDGYKIHSLDKLARDIFRRYIATKRRLINGTSDFFTLLNIFEQWLSNGKTVQWAESNFLSVETLDEATNIKEELIDIALQNQIGLNDREGKDLYLRLEKTLCSAFGFNLLSIQSNGLYTNLYSGEKNIRIHNSSVLYDKKPQHAVAFEIIEISDIGSKPKLSAKFIHSIDAKKIRIHFPRMINKLKQTRKKITADKVRRYRKHHKMRKHRKFR